jgi:hypothetical protein
MINKNIRINLNLISFTNKNYNKIDHYEEQLSGNNITAIESNYFT